jgi:hypothetical protein
MGYGSLFGYVYTPVRYTRHDKTRLKPARLTASPSSVVRLLHVVPAWCESTDLHQWQCTHPEQYSMIQVVEQQVQVQP